MRRCGFDGRKSWMTYIFAVVAALAGGVASAQPARDDVAATVAGLSGGSGAPRIAQTPDGDLRYLGAPAGGGFAAAGGSPAEAARAFLLGNGSSFGVRSANVDFAPLREKTVDGRTYVRLQQTCQGLPVFGAEAVVQVGKGNRIESALVDILRRTGGFDGGRRSLTPALDAAGAEEIALNAAKETAPGNLMAVADPPQLLIYAPEVVGNTGEPVLAWSLVVQSALPGAFKERILVDAQKGELALRFSLIQSAKNRQIFDSNNTSANPGTLARSEGGPASGVSDVNLAYDYYGDTYDFLQTNHGRDSIDNAGYTLSATVRYCDPDAACPFENAFWDGSRMYFGQGFAAADDVVAHELAHGFTQYESNLIYLNQSGALNESFSDVWGEFVDQSNGAGTDTPAVKWLMGEDVPGFGAIRNMKDPTTFGDPDRTCSPNFYEGSADNGGVHINSGVSNKLCYLLTDGDTFNGQTVTAMGIPLVADLYYEVQTNLLTSSSDYLDFYNALTQAAINLGLNATQQANIEAACLAVEITASTSCVLPPPPPANDDCAAAVPVTLNTLYTGELGGATGASPQTCGGFPLGDFNDVWYTFAPPSTGLYTVSLCGSGFTDTTLFVFTGTCASNTVVACDDESCGIAGLGVPSTITTTLNQGTTYLIRVAGYAGSGGPYALVVLSGDGSGGDTCDSSVTGMLDNFSPRFDRRSDVLTDTACDAFSFDSAFNDMAYAAFAFHADAAGLLSASVALSGTSIVDSTLFLYCGSFDPDAPEENLIAWNDDDGLSYLSAFDPADGLALQANTTYWLVVSTYLGSSGGLLLDSGDFELCLGEGFTFGPAQSTGDPCALLTCPPFDAQGSGFYAYLSVLLSNPLSYETEDIDGLGIPEAFEVALAEAILCEGRAAWSADAQCVFGANLETLADEPGYAALQGYDDVIAAMLATSSEMKTLLGTVLGLTGDYAVFNSGAKLGAEDLSPGGDPDQDGYTNLDEYLNVLADGGGEEEYVTAALNPLLDGSSASVAALPAAGIAGAAALAALLLPAALRALRRPRD